MPKRSDRFSTSSSFSRTISSMITKNLEAVSSSKRFCEKASSSGRAMPERISVDTRGNIVMSTLQYGSVRFLNLLTNSRRYLNIPRSSSMRKSSLIAGTRPLMSLSARSCAISKSTRYLPMIPVRAPIMLLVTSGSETVRSNSESDLNNSSAESGTRVSQRFIMIELPRSCGL